MKMNRILICSFITLIIILFTYTAKVSASETKSSAKTVALQVVLNLIKGDYTAVTKQFDNELAKAISTEQLKNSWEGIIDIAGKYYDIVYVESYLQDGRYICKVTTQHKLRGIESKIVYNKNMQISELLFTDIENKSDLSENEVAVTIGTDYPLDGVLALPSGTEKVPAVVLVHGSGASNKNESVFGIKPFKDISNYLVANGIAVLRYDKRTYTHSVKLSLDPTKVTVANETIEDAILAGQLLSQNERIDSKRIFVVGHSQGGILAPRIIDESNGVFAGAVIMAGSPRSLLEILNDQLTYFVSLTEEPERTAMIKKIEAARPYFGIPKEYIDEMDAHPVSDYLKSTDKPYLILQGAKDYQITVEKDFEAYKQLVGQKSNFEFRLYDNLNHLFIISTMERPTGEDYVAGSQVDEAPLLDIVKWIKAK